MNIPEEAAIIAECRRGNLTRFSQLYDAYVERIYRFIYYRTHHRETAQDITADVFVKALERFRSFDAAKGTFSGWLYGIARNAVIDHYRAYRAHGAIEDVWDLASDADIERDADMRQNVEAVERYLKGLPSAQRDLIIMRVWDGMSYREMAEATGKTEESMRMMYSRAVRELRKNISLIGLIALILHL